MEPWVVAVDWGTTSFRAWLLSTSGHVMRESRSEDGLKSAIDIGFDIILRTNLSALDVPADTPVIMCGMVGSRQGWCEAGYVDVPTDLNEISNLAIRVLEASREVMIMPGIAQRDEQNPDVMRGEETQLLGAVGTDTDATFCMPGTHSKWVTVSAGKVVQFSTYMTGELFEVISKHSILAHSILSTKDVQGDDPVFLNAVDRAIAKPQSIANELFKLRAGGILDMATGSVSAQLSGLLIGLELADLDNRDTAIKIIGSSQLAHLYFAALGHIGVKSEMLDADECVRNGLIVAAQGLWPQATFLKEA